MKLSSRKELLKESELTLKSIKKSLNEVNTFKEFKPSQKKSINKIKNHMSIVESELVSAITEMRGYKKIMSGLIKKIETTGPLTKSEMDDALNQFWVFSGKSSSLNKFLDSTQEFAHEIQELQK